MEVGESSRENWEESAKEVVGTTAAEGRILATVVVERKIDLILLI